MLCTYKRLPKVKYIILITASGSKQIQISNKNQRGTFLETSPALKKMKKHSFKSILLALLKNVCTGEKNIVSAFYKFI